MPFRQEDVRMRKVIISLAPVEAGLPVDKEALAEDVVRSAAAGAAMCHALPPAGRLPHRILRKWRIPSIALRNGRI